MSSQTDFFTKMMPYAVEASNRTHVPVSVILAQWANESAYGTSDLAKNANNFGGINHTGNSIAAGTYGAYAKYSDINQFVDDYVRVLNLSYYDKVRAAGTVDGAVRALGDSPYAGSHYSVNGVPGQSLANIINQYHLSSVIPTTDGMPADDLKKYAAIGLAVVGLIALAGTK